jgi:hypothetical protein
MPSATTSLESAHRLALRVLLLLGLLYGALLTILLIAHSMYQLSLIYFLPLLMFGLMLRSVQFFRSGTARVSLPVFVTGCAFLLGGIAFDMVATGVHTPDLAIEANPLARALLDSGHAVLIVYIYGLIMQTALGVVLCALWGALLRHRNTWLAAATEEAHCFAQFFRKAAWDTGAAQRGTSFLRAPLCAARAYQLVFVVTFPLVMGEGLQRWYLGLEWFRLVPYFPFPCVALGAIGLAFVVLVGWLAVQYLRSRPERIDLR